MKKLKVFITGGSKGLGFEIAKKFVSEGHDVFLTARNVVDLSNACEKLYDMRVNSGQKINFMPADISVLQNVEEVFDFFIEKFSGINVLINNAAEYGELGNLEDFSEFQNWATAINTNLVAPAHLVKLSIPYMEKEGFGKIIQISGGGATAPLESMSAYASSKAGVVKFVECMALELEKYKIDINAISPGIMNTGLLQEVLENPDKVGKTYYKIMSEYSDFSFEEPVDLVYFLSSSLSDGISGKLISAKYDKWKEFKNHKEDIMSSNAYTIRRITGSQCGFEWDDLGAK